MKVSSTVDRFIPLKPKDHYILSALLDGDRHGYAIAKEIRALSGGRVRVEAGNLHRHLQKLVRQGLVSRSDPRRGPDVDERRRYYAITALGRRVWARDIEHMESVVQAAHARKSPATSGRA